MDCRDFRRRYSEYRDDHDPELAAEMDDHLELCPYCTAFDRAVREGVEVLRGKCIVPSAGFQERLERRLRSGEQVPEALPPRVAPWAATAAMILFATLIALSLRDLMVLPEPVAAEVQPMVIAQPQIVPGIPFVIYERARP
jgi:hypothetical protein